MKITAAEAERRFGGKWGKWEREMFERLTTAKNLERFLKEEEEFVDLRTWLAENAKFSALDGSLESFRRYVIEKKLSPLVYSYLPVWESYREVKRSWTGERGGGKFQALRGAYVGVRNNENFWLGKSRMYGYVYGNRLTFADGEIRIAGEKNAIAAAAVVAIEKFIEEEYLRYAFDFSSNGKEEIAV